MKKLNIKIPLWRNTLDNWTTTDIENKSGSITSHCRSSNQSLINYKKYFVDEAYDEPHWVCEQTGSKFSMNSVSLAVKHITTKLNKTVHDYVNDYPDMKDFLEPGLRQEKNRLISEGKLNADQMIQSPLDGKYYHRLIRSHLQKHGYNSVKEFHVDYPGHPVCSTQSSLKASRAVRSNNSTINRSNVNLSITEVKIINSLIKNRQDFEIQYQLEGKRFDFYFPENEVLIELENDFHHATNITYLSFTEVKNYANDIEKYNIAKKLGKRLRYLNYDKVKDEIDFTRSKMFNLSEEAQRELIQLTHFDVILSKEYLVDFKKEYGENKLRNEMASLKKFVRQQMPQFVPPNKKEDLLDAVDSLQKYDYDKVRIGKDYQFNKLPSSGSGYLKNNFTSFWKAHNRNTPNIYQAWEDDVIFDANLLYRCGVNKLDETFNITLNDLIRGLMVQKYVVSWFRPGLASAIYEDYIGSKENPVVVDPCAGFGARMLGFYAKYPKGTYIGVDCNPETFAELRKLALDLKVSPILYNDYFEEIVEQLPDNPDFVFTSIPYWNTEIYSHNHTDHYKNSYDEWAVSFLAELKNYCSGKNNLINMSEKIFEREFSSNVAHNLILSSGIYDKTEKLNVEKLVVL